MMSDIIAECLSYVWYCTVVENPDDRICKFSTVQNRQFAAQAIMEEEMNLSVKVICNNNHCILERSITNTMSKIIYVWQGHVGYDVGIHGEWRITNLKTGNNVDCYWKSVHHTYDDREVIRMEANQTVSGSLVLNELCDLSKCIQSPCRLTIDRQGIIYNDPNKSELIPTTLMGSADFIISKDMHVSNVELYSGDF